MKQQIIPRKAIKLPEVRRVQGAQDRQNRQDTQSTQSTQRTQGAHAVQSAQSTQNEQGRQRTQGAHGVQGVLDRQNRQDTQSAQKTQDAQDQQSTQDTQGASSRKRTALSKTTLQALAIPALLVIILYGAMRSGALPHIHAFAPGAPDTPGKSGSSLNAPANSSQQPQDTSIRSEPLNAQGEPANAQADDWRLLLVNPWNELPAGYQPALYQLANGHAVDERCYPDLQQMMDDCRAAGQQPLICSSYRTQETQQYLFDSNVNSLMAQGYTLQEAAQETATYIAVPGTSEHQLGLAVDIVDEGNQSLDEQQAYTPTQQWLMQNSWRYGFILRFPSDKTSITGITYEPWHYRYVGREAAQHIYEQQLCLEEYLGQEA